MFKKSAFSTGNVVYNVYKFNLRGLANSFRIILRNRTLDKPQFAHFVFTNFTDMKQTMDRGVV